MKLKFASLKGLTVFFVLCAVSSEFCWAESVQESNTVNPHWVGWMNLIFPGAGAALRGQYGSAAIQFGYETGSFAAGYLLSDQKGFSSLDGISDSFRPFSRTGRSRNDQSAQEKKMGSDILLEFSIKAHMANIWSEYRDAYRDQGVTQGLDQHTTLEGVMLPFNGKYIQQPDVWVPILLVAGATLADYMTNKPDAIVPLTPASNVLYDFNNGIWQSVGSGYPEEAFFRGFLQNEMKLATHSPLAAVALQSVAFAFSHEQGSGRYSAALVGAYLGYLAEKYHGDLGPGTTIHFWGVVILGIESILLSHNAQHSTAQTGFAFQFNY